MKRVYLLRHAQALPMEEGSDFDRPLTPKGIKDAEALGAFMTSQDYKPDVILCSGAQRTRDTHEALLKGFGESFSPSTTFSDEIYDGRRGDYFKMLQEVAAGHNSAMLIGHNPTIYELAGFLAAQGPDGLMSRLAQGYMPASLSVIDVNVVNWEDLDPEKGTLFDFVNPQDYNAPARPTRWM